MRRRHLAKLSIIGVALAFSAAPCLGQSADILGLPVEPGTGPGTFHVEQTGSLTTTFAGGNGYAGNTFDIENTGGVSITITGWDVHLDTPGATETISIYWRAGTSVGYESSSAGWTLLGSDTGVVSAGDGNPSAVTMPPITIPAGALIGFYLDLSSYVSGGTSLRYTNGGPNTYSNSDITLTTYYGKGTPAFTGSTFTYRAWNGTVYYDILPVELQSFSIE